MPNFTVHAHWDPEAKVWYSQSDVPGLVIEAESIEQFEEAMQDLVPEMLHDNAGIEHKTVAVDFVVHQHRELAVA